MFFSKSGSFFRLTFDPSQTYYKLLKALQVIFVYQHICVNRLYNIVICSTYYRTKFLEKLNGYDTETLFVCRLFTGIVLNKHVQRNFGSGTYS